MPNESTFLNVPVAIVIAGALIAGAIYFGGGQLGGRMAGSLAPTTPAATLPAQPAPEPVGTFRPVTTTDHIRGAANAKVTVIEYSDLECPFCKRFHPTLLQLLREYPNDVRLVYRHAPLEQLHAKAPKEAEAVECAGEQGKFWELVDKIFEVTPANDGLNLDDLPKLAAEAGVANAAQFKNCLDSGKYAQRVADDLADAQAAGMSGTPYSVVVGPEGEKLPVNGAVPYESLKATVESVLP